MRNMVSTLLTLRPDVQVLVINGWQSHVVLRARSLLIRALLDVKLLNQGFSSVILRFVDIHFVIYLVSRRILRLNILLNFLSGFLMHFTLNGLFDCWHATISSHVSLWRIMTLRVFARIVVGFRKLIRYLAEISHAIWESNGVEESTVRVLSVH